MPLMIKFSDFLDKPKDPKTDFVQCKFGSTSCTHEATHKNNHGVDMCFECLKINAKHQQRQPKMVLRQPMPQYGTIIPQELYDQTHDGDRMTLASTHRMMQEQQQMMQQDMHQRQQEMMRQQMQVMGNMQQPNTPAHFGDQSLPRNAGFFGMSWRNIVGLPPESEGSD